MKNRYVSVDMDETILCTVPAMYINDCTVEPDSEISLFKNGEKIPSFVFKRPGIDNVLDKFQSMGFLNLFTLGVHDYVYQALESTDLLHYFDRIFTRESCQERAYDLADSELALWGVSKSQACMVKDLRLVDENLNMVIAIDDNFHAYPIPQRSRVLTVASYDPFRLDNGLSNFVEKVSMFFC